MSRVLPRLTSVLILLAGTTMFSGCSVGPRRLAPVRFDYNQAIARSLDEQLLLNLVRLRYRDTPVFLELSTLLTQYTLTGTANLSPTIVIGGDDQVATGVGASLSETPTIGFTPLQGQDFATRILSPISPESIVLLSNAGWSIERLLGLTVQELNGIRNAVPAAGPTPATAPEYEAFQELGRRMRALQQADLLESRTGADGTVRLVFKTASSEGEQSDLEAVKTFLGVPVDVDELRIVSVSTAAEDELVMHGRSLLAAMFFLSQGVEPPEQHVREGKVTVTRDAAGQVFDWKRVVGNLLTIHSSPTEPADPFVAIRYRDHWFYIEDSDLNGKTTFNLLSYLFSLQAASGQGASPLLTVPAGG